MSISDKDRSILEHVISYCDDIYDAMDRFGRSVEVFSSDKEYRNACALCILQIGELCGHLSVSFRTEHSEMPWSQIKGMRNVVAHRYGNISLAATWETMETDIPALKRFCEDVLQSQVEDQSTCK